jgi:hypothetical protein
MVSLIAIIVIVKMVENGQQEAGRLITEAGQTCLTNAREVCNQILTDRVSNTAP